MTASSDEDSVQRVRSFYEFERRHSLFSYMPDGWSLWRVLRHPLHRRIQALPLEGGSIPSPATRLKNAIVSTVQVASTLLAVRDRTILVKTSRSALKLKCGTRYQDVFVDNILRSGYSFIKVEETNSTAFERQGAQKLIPSHFDSSFINGLARLLAELLPYRKKGMSFCRQISQLMERELRVSISEKWLLTRVSVTYWQARIYEALLRVFNARIVIVTDTSEYGLILACKRRNTPIIEVQHGVFDSAHPDAIPSWANFSRMQLLLPDILACRGQYWIERLASTHQGNTIAKSVGSELIDHARSKRKARIHDGTYRIVVSSQGLDSDEMEKWLRSMIVAAPTNMRWEMHVKLHPAYDGANSPLFKLNCFENVTIVQSGADTTIYDLLADADLHLSISSACHFDAAALDVPSVVIPLKGHETILDAIDSTSLYLAKKPEDVWGISAQKSLGREAHYSAPKYSTNMLTLIRTILDE